MLFLFSFDVFEAVSATTSGDDDDRYELPPSNVEIGGVVVEETVGDWVQLGRGPYMEACVVGVAKVVLSDKVSAVLKLVCSEGATAFDNASADLD